MINNIKNYHEKIDTEPIYFSYTKKQQDEFISQIGLFSETERELFHILCEQKGKEVDFDRFVLMASRGGYLKNVAKELVTLIGKLNKNKLAVLITEHKNNKTIPIKVILTNKADKKYYFYLIGEQYKEIKNRIYKPFPTLLSLKDKTEGINENQYKVLEQDSFNRQTLVKLSKKQTIYLIKLNQDNGILVTSDFLLTVVSLAKEKVREALAEKVDLTSLLASKMKTGLQDLNNSLKNEGSLYWIKTSDAFLKLPKEIKINKKYRISQEEAVALYIINRYEKGEQVFQSQRVQEKKIIKGILNKLLTFVKTKGILDEKELEGFLSKLSKMDKSENIDINNRTEYLKDKEKAVQVLEYFYNIATNINKKKQEAPIVYVVTNKTGTLIDKGVILKYFQDKLNIMRSSLRNHYMMIMENYLKSREPFFVANLQMLQDDIKQTILVYDAELAELLEMSQVIAGALKGSISIEKRKNAISKRWYGVELNDLDIATRFNDYDLLFKINLVEIFESSTQRLSLLRRIVLAITGQGKSKREVLNEITPLIKKGSDQKKVNQPTLAKTGKRKRVYKTLIPE